MKLPISSRRNCISCFTDCPLSFLHGTPILGLPTPHDSVHLPFRNLNKPLHSPLFFLPSTSRSSPSLHTSLFIFHLHSALCHSTFTPLHRRNHHKTNRTRTLRTTRSSNSGHVRNSNVVRIISAKFDDDDANFDRGDGKKTRQEQGGDGKKTIDSESLDSSSIRVSSSSSPSSSSSSSPSSSSPFAAYTEKQGANYSENRRQTFRLFYGFDKLRCNYDFETDDAIEKIINHFDISVNDLEKAVDEPSRGKPLTETLKWTEKTSNDKNINSKDKDTDEPQDIEVETIELGFQALFQLIDFMIIYKTRHQVRSWIRYSYYRGFLESVRAYGQRQFGWPNSELVSLQELLATECPDEEAHDKRETVDSSASDFDNTEGELSFYAEITDENGNLTVQGLILTLLLILIPLTLIYYLGVASNVFFKALLTVPDGVF